MGRWRPAILAIVLVWGGAAWSVAAQDMMGMSAMGQGRSMTESDFMPDSTIQHSCFIGDNGIVRIDRRINAWRDDWCGPLPAKRAPTSCQEDPSHKLYRLSWSDTFWIYVRVTRHSPTIAKLCPKGMDMADAATPAWTALGPREDDTLLAAKAH
jgi:hypothetical protein